MRTAARAVRLLLSDLGALFAPKNTRTWFLLFAMLVVQALLFYAVTTPYLIMRRPRLPPTRAERFVDPMTVAAMLAASAIIVWLYVVQLGQPPLIKVLLGELSGLELIQYRVEQTYGLADYSLFHIGITVLPTIVSALALLLALNGHGRWYYAVPLIALSTAALPGGKGSIMDVVLALVAAYCFFCAGLTAAPRKPLPLARLAALIVIAFVPIVLMYGVYYGSTDAGDTAIAILYRLIGVNSESMAAAVQYTHDVGFLNGATLPTVRGLFGHSYVNLAQEMHLYMFGPGGGAPISTLAEGYVNFGWTGFVGYGVVAFGTIIGVEILLRKFRKTYFSVAVLVLGAIFASKVAQASIVATFISLTYVMMFAVILAFRLAARLVWRVIRTRDQSLRSPLEQL